MNTTVLVVLLSILALAYAQRPNGFDPPSALSNPSPPSFVAPAPIAPVPAVPAATYTVSGVDEVTPAPFSVVVLPSAFSYGSGPFSPYTKIPGTINPHLDIPELSPFHFEPLDYVPYLYGTFSGASMVHASMGVVLAAALVVLAF